MIRCPGQQAATWAVVMACGLLQVARASDFATEVVASDGLRSLWNDPTQALGPPTIDCVGDGWDINPAETVPVVPLYPPFNPFNGDYIVSINPGGFLTLAFDHPVEDDPRNPYGLDLIVFGNALQRSTNSGAWLNRDPGQYALNGQLGSEAGVVSVSQDGTNWFTFTNGPHADTFAPTLGRRYTPDAPDPAVGAWNQWWGAPTDPTKPHDPSITAADYAGMTLAEMCRVYRDSAGGTGFDIGIFDALPASSSNGLRWVRFVRIAGATDPATEPEVDAVSDVAPAPPYELWRLQHFSWWELADDDVSGPFADPGGNGAPNLQDYAEGRGPRTAERPQPLRPRHVAGPGDDYLEVTYDRRREAGDIVFRVEAARSLGAGVWSPDGILQEWHVEPLSPDTEQVTARVPATTGRAFARLRMIHQE